MNTERNTEKVIIGVNGNKLKVGNPGNKGGPGRTPNELRAKAREGVGPGIDFAKKVIEDESDKFDPRLKLDALKHLTSIGVPTQSEVIEIKDDQVIQWMYETLNELNCSPEFITQFKEKMDAKAQR